MALVPRDLSLDDPMSILRELSPGEIFNSVLRARTLQGTVFKVSISWSCYLLLASRGMGKQPQCNNRKYDQDDLGKCVFSFRFDLNHDLLIACLLSHLDLTPETGPSISLLPLRISGN